MPRSALALALLLSLLLHGVVLLALFNTERPTSSEAARANIVTVNLAASQPAAPPPTPAMPSPAPRSTSATSHSEPEEAHREGSEPPHTNEESSRASAAPARTASMANPPETKARAAMRPVPKNDASPAAPRLDEAPDNRAYDSPSNYLRLLAIRLAEVKTYPAAAVARHEEGVVLLAFRLDRRGHVLSWQIARSSGHDELDAEVSRMIALAAPFPPFPESWHEASGSFQVPIGFTLY